MYISQRTDRLRTRDTVLCRCFLLLQHIYMRTSGCKAISVHYRFTCSA